MLVCVFDMINYYIYVYDMIVSKSLVNILLYFLVNISKCFTCVFARIYAGFDVVVVLQH